MLSWLEQKPRQKNEFGIHRRSHAKEVDHDGMEQTANIPLFGIMTNLIRLRIIFLSSIFLSFECSGL
jgi:hypothetical protein